MPIGDVYINISMHSDAIEMMRKAHIEVETIDAH